MAWHAYILECADGTYYAGATNDLKRRLAMHVAGTGAKYVRGRCPVVLVWKRKAKDRSAAQKLEASIKRMTRSAKRALIGAAGTKGRGRS